MYHKGTVYVLKLKGIIRILCKQLSQVWLGDSPAYANISDKTELFSPKIPVNHGNKLYNKDHTIKGTITRSILFL